MSSSSSSMPLEIKLQNEIKKRINENELSKNDLEYYQRKIRRIQNELSISQDEVSKLRIKLKRAEDFQLKYELLFKQLADAKSNIDSKTNQINMLQTLNEQLKLSLQEKASSVQDFSLQRANLLQEIAKWKDRFQDLKHKAQTDLQDQRIRSQQTIKLNQNKVRSEYKEKQEDLVYQIHQLKKVIQQKQTVESIINGRVQKIRSQKDEQINRLKQILNQKKQSYDQYMKEKNEELQRMKDKFEKMINFDIENLKNNQEDQEELFHIQLNGLREMIGLKNDEIRKLLDQMSRLAKQHQRERKDLMGEIAVLKEKIYTVQRQADIQLQNLKDRLITIHAQDSKTMEDRYQKIIQTLKTNLQDSKLYVSQLQRLQQSTKQQYQRAKGDLNDRIKQKDKRIHELLGNLQSRGQLNASQLKLLHQSFHQITSEKQIMASQYQSNVTFMSQQIAKLNSFNQIKTKQITKLHEQLHQLKIAYQERLLEWQAKYRKERKQRQEERQQERLQKEKLNQKIQQIQRQCKNQIRRLQRQKEKVQRQRSKAQYMLEQSQRDIERLNKYIKQLDESLKNQFKKNQLALLDKDGLRREILSQLEKQKVQLEAMKLMQIDQVKKKYEMENARLSVANEQLKTQILNKSIAYENLESEFKKIDFKHRNADRLQKDKIKEYEQKMITLTQQIGITQNLYKAFLDAKARAEQ